MGMKIDFLPHEKLFPKQVGKGLPHGETTFFAEGIAVNAMESERGIGTNDSPHESLVVESRGGCRDLGAI